MRLHRLEVSGFGPFAGRESIDFDEVVRQGLFLLHGQTGAGKTSLLDAICFALFGSVPGARGQTERLTSDHAASGMRPGVVCEFTASGRRLKVTRSPAWERPKSRGTGTTKEKAQVFVQEWTGGAWVARAQRADEAGQVLADALGMGKDQFTKVVLLPQGDFAAFLRASPDERRTLLEKLFGTARFGRIEDWLANARSEAKAHLLEIDGRRSDLMARADERAASVPGIDRTELLGLAALPPEAVGEASVALLAGWQHRATEAALAAEAAARVAAEVSKHARADAERVADRLQRASTLFRALQDHEIQLRSAAARAVDRERLRRAELAERVRSRLRSIDLAAAKLRRASEAVEHAVAPVDSIALLAPAQRRSDAPVSETELPGQLSFDLDAPLTAELSPDTDSAPGDLSRQQLDEEITARHWLIARIDELIPTEDTLTAAQTAVVSQTRELGRITRTRADLKTTIEAVKSRLREQSAEREARVPVVATLDDRRAARDRAVARRDAAVEVARLRPEVDAATDRHQSAVDRAQSARAHHLTLVQRRLDSMAAELAGQLVEGDACPVCGAAEHPQPAVAADLVTAAEVAAADEQATRLDDLVAGAAIARADLREQLSAARTSATGLTTALAEEQLGAARVAIEQAEAAEVELAQLDASLAAHQATLTEAESRLDKLGSRQDVVQNELSRLTAQVTESRRSVEGLRGSFDTLAGRRAALAAEYEQLTVLAHALDNEAAARATCEQACTEADSDCAAIGFDSRSAAAGALLGESERFRLAAAIEAGTKAAAAAAARLTDADLHDAVDEAVDETGLSVDAWPPRDAEATTAALTRLTSLRDQLVTGARAAQQAAAAREQEAAQAQSLAAQIRPSAKAIAELCADVRTLVDEIAPLRERAATLEELAATAQGVSASNARKLRLSAFVLEARLEQVAEAASLRLHHMSSGRYTLLLSESRGKGGGRSGLGLRVMDAWTSMERDTASLSGGESFLASLALALGLADVVQAESGGISIETLFIDEGFGTLDEDTLELVMEVLDQLREGGRAVGVVSHVGELRGRIPSQLQVIKGHQGSRVVVTQRLAS